MEEMFHNDKQCSSHSSSSNHSERKRIQRGQTNLFDSVKECLPSSSQEKSKSHKSSKNQQQEEKSKNSFLSRFNPNLQELTIDQALTLVPNNMKPNQESVCLIHQKVLDIICLKDENIICANCAIFGHKGHYFKSLKEFEQQKLSYCKMIVQTLCQREKLKNKITSKETKSLVKDKLNAKREEMVRNVKKQYQHWYKQLQQSQISSIEKINKHIIQLQKTVQQKLIIPNNLENQYKEWHKYADREMDIFENHSIDEQIKVMNYMKKPKAYDIQSNGTLIVQEFQSIYENGIRFLKEEIEKLKLNIDNKISSSMKNLTDSIISNKQDTFNEMLTETLKLYDHNNSSNIENRSCNNSKQQLDNLVEDLLIQSEIKIPKLVEIDQNKPILPWDISQISNQFSRNRLISLPNEVDLTCSSIISSKIQSPPRKSTSKSRPLYHFSSKSSIKSPRTTMLSGIKTSAIRTPRTQSEQRYQQLVDNMIKSHSNVLNLDGAQLGDNKLVNILERLRCVKIRTAILSRNKLSDAFVEKMWTLMPHVETVNLSGNNLTDRILNNMLTTRRLQKNKNLILNNNKIKQKEAKFKIEALHRLGVHIEM